MFCAVGRNGFRRDASRVVEPLESRKAGPGRRAFLNRTLTFAAALACLAPAAVRATTDSTWVDHYRAARAAYAARDYAGFRAHILRVGDMIGEQPGVNYNLACAAALLGERDEALRRLRLYAASGLARDAAADSDLVSLWDDPEFRAVAAGILANGDSIGTATVRHRFEDASLLTEDITCDPKTQSFFVTSVHRGGLVEVDSADVEHRLSDPGAPPGWGAFGACVDAPRRLLWTCTGATRTTDGYVAADSGRTALVAWNLDTLAPVHRIERPRDGTPHLFGDLTVAPDGTVYVTDSMSGSLERVAPGGDSIEVVLPDGTFHSPQTPALAADARRLYVPDYSAGIAIVDLALRSVRWMTFAPGIGIQGIDGLYVRGRDLIAVQNGTHPKRVMRFRLDATGTRVVSGTPIESGTHRLGEPTHAVIVGSGLFFLARTGWERVGRDGALVTRPYDAPAAILRAELGTGD